jgi:predicted nucleic acid-binding protein
MGLILDTSVVIRAERGLDSIDRLLVDDECGMSILTVSELHVGLHRATTDRHRERRSQFLARVLAQVPVFDFDMAITQVHAKLRASLLTSGLIIGAHDLIIAATALHLGWAVRTTNEREFRRIDGLSVI